MRVWAPWLLLAIGLSQQVLASSTPTVVVEATRIAGETIEASRSATIVTQENLLLKRPITVADILRELPGVEVVRQGGSGQTTTVFIRGAKSESTLVLIDGIEANDLTAPSGGFDFSTLSPTNILRIEIYRGPQSVRFGDGALGGVINIVTQEGTGVRGGDYFIEAGSFETRRVAAGVRARLGSFGYAVATELFSTAGFSAAERRLGNREKDSTAFGTASAKLTYHKNSITRFESTLRLAQAETELDRGGGAAADDPNNESTSSQALGGLTGETRYFNEQLHSKIGFYFLNHERDSQNKIDSSSTETSKDDFTGTKNKIETSHELSLRDWHKLRLDVQWRYEQGRGDSVFNGVLSRIGKKSQGTLGEALTYLYDDDEWFGDVGVRSDQSDDFNDVLSKRFSLGRYLAKRDTKIYLSYGTGFKLPTLYQRYSSFGNSGLEKEESKTIEATLQGQLSTFDQSSMSVFNNTFHNMIDFDSGTNKYLNIAKARSRGLELQSNLKLTPSLKLKASATYLEAIDEKTGLRLLRRPSRVGALELERKFEKWSSSVQYTYRSQRPDSDPVTAARITNGSYSLVDLGVQYDIAEATSLRFRVENLFDQHYEEVAGYGTAGLSGYLGLSGGF